MKLHLGSDVVLTTTDHKQKSTIRLCLTDQSLWIGDIENGDDIERKIPLCFGSFPFLWDGGITSPFDRQSSRFTCLMLNFPADTIQPANTNMRFTPIVRGSVAYHQQQNFDCPAPEGMYYDTKNDQLVFYSDTSFFSNNEYRTVELVDGVELILDASATIVGLLVNDPVQYLDTDTTSKDSRRNLFRQAIVMLDDTNIEKMEDEDKNLKQDLIALASESHGDRPLLAFFQNLLQEYYQHAD